MATVGVSEPVRGRRFMPALRRRSVVTALAVFVFTSVACNGGVPSATQRTSTAQGAATAAQRTAEASGPAPTAKDISETILLGFAGVSIAYTEVSIDTFRKPDKLLGVLSDCAADHGQGIAREDPAFWPAVLGDCYTVGDATKWLYGYTGKREFAYANQLMKRFMREKVDEANAGGAGLPGAYWQQVADAIFTLPKIGTPIAVTPPNAGPVAGTPSP